MTHDNQNARIFAKDVVKGLEVKHSLMNCQLLVHLLDCLYDCIKHDIWLNYLSFRHRNKLIFCILGAESISICEDDIRPLLELRLKR